MTVRGTLGLVAVLVVLLALVWIGERSAPPPGAPAIDAPPLLAAAPSSVTRLEWVDRGRRLILVRAPGGWIDVAGRPWRSNAPGDLLEALTTLRPVAVVSADTTTLGEYGLGADASRLEVLGADGEAVLRLDLGKRNPAWTGVYVRREGTSEVLLVGALLHWELRKLRDAEPIPETLTTAGETGERGSPPESPIRREVP
ncbi:MAG: DUF4340 domain-containing protein [bacterium]|nr:DUF4340 domain-containing protein [bacterium]